MAITTTNITGDIALPDGTIPSKSSVTFVMTGFDTDASADTTIAPRSVTSVLSDTGALDVDLWSNEDGERTTFYNVRLNIYNGNSPKVFDVGKIEVPTTGGPYDLNDLLPIAPPSGATVDEYIAQLAAAVASAEAAADTAVAAAAPAQVLVDNIRLTRDTFAEIAAITSSELGVGEFAKINGFRYVRVVSGGAFSGDGITLDYVPIMAGAAGGIYFDAAYGVAADGSTDDTSAYALIASNMDSGATLRVVGSGTRVISSAVVFPQDNIRAECDPGATFKQADGTQTIDTLITLSGVRPSWRGGIFDANVSNNGSYTGRGEMLKILGDALGSSDDNVGWIDGVHFIGTHATTAGTGVYMNTETGYVSNITGTETGGNLVRMHTDYGFIRGVRLDEISGSSNAGIGQDSAFTAGQAFKLLVMEDIVITTSDTVSNELILVDDNTYTGGDVVIRNAQLLSPNMTADDNVFKVVNVDSLTLESVNTDRAQGAGDSVCLRLQGDVAKIHIKDCSLSGFINFDGSTSIDMTISGNTVIGRDLTSNYAIQQFPGGSINIQDGVSISGYGVSAILTAATTLGRSTVIEAGALHLEGTDASNAVFASYSWTNTERPKARQIRIKPPLSISGQRNRDENKNWVISTIRDEPLVLQDGVHLCDRGAGDFAQMTATGPERIFDWYAGAVLRALTPASGDSELMRVCTTAGIAAFDWVGSTAYVAGDYVGNGGNAYVCTTGGTSAASGGPTGTVTGITDGTVTWDYAGVHAAFDLAA